LLCAFVFLAWTSAVHSADAERPQRILIVSTGSRLAPGFVLVDQQLLQELGKIPYPPIEIYAENLDIIRFPAGRFQRIFTEYLTVKYAENPPDLVILVYVGNLGTPGKLLPQLFPGTPIVVAGLTEEEIRPNQFTGLVSGIAQRVDPRATLELILRLQPKIRRVVVIGGTAEVDRQVLRRVKEVAQSFKGRIEIDFWDNLKMAELRERVAALPQQTAILFARLFRDAAGQAFVSAQVGQSIAQTANVPVYVMSDSSLGTGAVGGSVASIEAFGKRAGELARLILTGGAPPSPPFEIRTDSVPTFDWRALKRWGIDESRLPPGSVVRFKPESIWEHYRWYIIGALVIIALQAGLIANLLFHRSRRRRAEAKLRESEQNFRSLVETTAAIPWQANLDTWVFTYMGPQAVSLLGYPLERWYEKDFWVDHLHPDDRDLAVKTCSTFSKTTEQFEFDYRMIAASGKTVWVHDIVNCEHRDGAPVQLRGFLIDITKRKQAEEALRESEDRFRNMADTAPVMIWMSGPDRLTTFFNKGWLDFTGRALEQELGNGWGKSVHTDDHERCGDLYASAFNERQEFTMEYRLRRHDGEYCWVLDHGVPRFEADGTFLGYIGTAIDISELKRGEEKFRLAVERSPNAIVMVNGRGRIVLVNFQAEKLFGYSRDELISQPVELLVPERFRGEHPDHRAGFLDAPAARPMGAGRDLHARRKDGSEVLVEIGLNPIQTQEGLLVLTSIVDISARKQAEDTLEKERAFLRQVIDIDPNFIFAKDREGRFTLVNQAVADAYGTTVDKLIGKTDADFNPNRDEVEFFHRMDLEVMDTLQERFIPEERITDARGKFRWLQTVKRPILEKDGSTHQVLGVSTDITRRREAESELQQQREELAHVTRVSALGELTASLAHELNQPLTAILSNAQAAQRFLSAEPPDVYEVREILKDIVQDNSRAGEVIRRLRALARKEQPDFAPLEMSNVIDDVVSLLHSDSILHNVRVSLEIGRKLPLVRGDKIQLQQVVLNLLLNAFDAMKDCPAHERQVIVRGESEDSAVKVAVRDRGIGLTGDKRDKIFQPFYTTKRDGLGMGLSICRSIIEAHSGRLWAENNPDRGATFFFTLPVEKLKE
jgi:PAS domain S-box-containing protein